MVNNLTVEEVTANTFHNFPRNKSHAIPGFYDLPVDDATFPILTCLIIFQMQTGFALVEAGIVRKKNGVNIMMKNIADVCIGGIAFWIFGFGLMFGRGEYSTPFYGAGDFFMDTVFGDPLTCQVFTLFLYQMSYATTSNTIVSGAIAERASFSSYCLLTFLVTVLYSMGAGWMWGEHGFLRNLGAFDASGGVIHIVGGAAGVACTWWIGPRLGRYDKGKEPMPMGNPMNVCVGMFILWWGWIAFNTGCSYGVTGGKWHYAARAGVGTALATWGAGAFSIIYSMFLHKGRVDVFEVISSIISALIMINSSCYLMPTYLCVLCGALASFFTISAIPLMDKFHIDDPIGVFSVHWLGGIWGYLTVGLFALDPVPLTTTSGREGLLMGGGWWFFTVQCIAIVSLTLLGFFGAFPILWLTNKVIPLRLDAISEEKGCDIVEHNIIPDSYSPYDAPPQHNDGLKLNNIRFDDTNINMPANLLNIGIYKQFNDSVRNRTQPAHVLEREGSITDSPKSIQRI